jgi:hypothetical protein
VPGGEDREVLAVDEVESGPSAPRRRVVHGREVVEREGGRVHHLDRGARVHELGARRREEVPREDDERGPHALAGREERLAGRGREGIERVRRALRRREERREARVHGLAHLREQRGERGGGPVRRQPKLASASFSLV